MTAVRARSDALRNAERVLEAAREVFGERGLAAGIDEVALRAGVGRATVYRCWSTKEELVAAVAGARIEWFTALLELAADTDDAWQALSDVLDEVAASCAQNALLYAGLTTVPQDDALQAQRLRCRAALGALLARAQAQGQVSATVTAGEVIVLLSGVHSALTASREQDVAVWRRHLALVQAATRA